MLITPGTYKATGGPLTLEPIGEAPPAQPQPSILRSKCGVHVGILDLTGPDGPARLDIYLKEIIAAGYKRVVRMDGDRRWGGGLAWWVEIAKVLRNNHFQLILILDAGAWRNPEDMSSAAEVVSWAQQLIPVVGDLLIGVQATNEEWMDLKGLPRPSDTNEFRARHNAIVSKVKTLTKATVVWADAGTVESILWIEKVIKAGGVIADGVSLHLYESGEFELQRILEAIRGLFPANLFWLTETNYPELHVPMCRRVGTPVDVEGGQIIVFSWNDKPYVLRPGGEPLP